MLIQTQLSLTLAEILGIIGLLSMIVGVWIDARIRISSLEIKMKGIISILESHIESNDSKFIEYAKEMREQSCETRKEIKEIAERIYELHLLIERKINQKEK